MECRRIPTLVLEIPATLWVDVQGKPVAKMPRHHAAELLEDCIPKENRTLGHQRVLLRRAIQMKPYCLTQCRNWNVHKVLRRPWCIVMYLKTSCGTVEKSFVGFMIPCRKELDIVLRARTGPCGAEGCTSAEGLSHGNQFAQARLAQV